MVLALSEDPGTPKKNVKYKLFKKKLIIGKSDIRERL